MKFSMITVSFFLFILAMTHVFLMPSGQRLSNLLTEYPKTQNVVIAYYGAWDAVSKRNYTVDHIATVAPLLTHVIYAFVKPNVQTGECELNNPAVDIGLSPESAQPSGGNFLDLLNLKREFPHLKILLSVGGSGVDSKNLSSIARNGKLEIFANSLIRLLTEYRYVYNDKDSGINRRVKYQYSDLFDGVDIDWEWNSAKDSLHDKKSYHLLISMLSKKLRQLPKRMLLTAAIEANSKIIKSLSLADIAPLVDWFHVMTYNYGGTFSAGTSMNAPIYSDTGYSVDGTISTLLEQGVSAQKMVLGIPLYGVSFDTASPTLGAPFRKTHKTKTQSYRAINQKYLQDPRCRTTWDHVAQVPCTYCKHDKVFVSHENEKSVQSKINYAARKKLKGIFFWRLAQDDDAHALINAVRG